MIIDVIWFLAGEVLQIYAYIFNFIGFNFPTEFSNAISYFFSQFAYFQGIFPIQTLFDCLQILVVFYSIYYTVKLLLSLTAVTPIIGKLFRMPKVSTKPGKN